MQLSAEELNNFEKRFNNKEFPQQRFGQAFCNLYSLTCPELFYEENYKTAKVKIWFNFLKYEEDLDG